MDFGCNPLTTECEVMCQFWMLRLVFIVSFLIDSSMEGSTLCMNGVQGKKANLQKKMRVMERKITKGGQAIFQGWQNPQNHVFMVNELKF